MTNNSSNSNSNFDQNQSDLELLQRAKRGDFAAFEQLVNRFQRRVFGVALRIVGQQQDAEDVTQQTFLSLVEHLDSYREEASVAAWILRIAANHALKVLRKRRGLPMATYGEPGSDDSYATMPHPDFIAKWSLPADTLAQQAETQRQIAAALSNLDEKYRTVFVLRDVEGLSIRDTASALDLTEATVKIRLLRARLMLREALTQAFGDRSTRMQPQHDHG